MKKYGKIKKEGTMKKSIRDFELKGKKVIIRVDFNVPMENGIITDDNRIRESLETIEYAVDHEAKVILLSHLGRIKTEEDKKGHSLKPIANRLQGLITSKVIFVPETRGTLVEEKVKNLNNGEILLLENTRFEDVIDSKESNDDTELGVYWASLGEIFINDAFGTAHRAHASNVGIASNLPSGIGFLIEKELKAFEPLLENPEHPFTIILGGAKVKDKIGVISNLVEKADQILIGGGMAYTFLKATGIEVGSSLVDDSSLDFCKKILEEYDQKIILPIDSVNADEISSNTIPNECFISDIKQGEMGLDIGHNTVKLFGQYLRDSKTILWNGPVGVFEYDNFSSGTEGICQILNDVDANIIIGGGDTVAAVKKLGYEKAMSFLSTGGGAALELLEGKTLPGIAAIDDL